MLKSSFTTHRKILVRDAALGLAELREPGK